VYGLLLLRSQTSHFVSLDESVKDSPYFLGFLLTLVALFKALTIAAAQLADTSTVPHGAASLPHLLLTAAGAAILPTVAGLFMRQALLARDPSEDARSAVFESLAEELRKHTVAFSSSQKQLIRLIDEFVRTRRDQLASEESAAASYVKHLEAATQQLSALAHSMASDAGAVHEELTRAASNLRLKLDESAEASSSAAVKLSRAVEGAFGASVASLVTASAEIGSQVAATRDRLAEFQSSLGSLATALADSSKGFSILAASTRESASQLVALPGAVSSLPAEAAAGLKQVVATATEAQAQVAGHLVRIAADLRDVDQVFEDLVKLLTDRLRQAAGSPN
jgi:hypothetical protein